MTERKVIPSWFEFVRRRDSSLAVSLFRQLNCGSTLEAREALYRASTDTAKDLGLIALQAHLAGSTAIEIVAAAIDYCHSLDLDLPLVDGAYAGGPDPGRLEAIEALFGVISARGAGRAERYAVKAVQAGSRNPAILRTYMRQRFRDGYFEDLLPLKSVARTDSTRALFDRVTQNAQLLRHGFDMPKPTDIKPIPDVEKNRALCLLHNSLPIVSGGYATRTHGLLKGIASQGFQVSGVTRLGFPHDRAQGDLQGNVEPCSIVDGIYYHRLIDPAVTYGKTPIVNYLKANILAHIPLVAHQRPAILHGMSNFLNGVTATYLAKRFGLKSVYEVRGLWEITRASRSPAYAVSDSFRQFVRMEAEACNNADRVICITKSLKQEMVNRGVDAAKISVVPNGVDTIRFMPRVTHKNMADRLGIASTDVVIGYVGSVVDYEGLDDLLWALRILIKEHDLTSVRLLVVGDGDALGSLQELTRQLDLSNHVIFTGRVPHDEVEDYYSLISIAPFPRRPLPVCEMVSPLKPLEAMAMEKCVLVSSVAALAEMVVDGDTGLIFEKGDVASLVATLRRVIDCPGLRARLGKRARAWVETQRSWTSLGAKVVELYRDMLGAGEKRSGVHSQPLAGAAAIRYGVLNGFFGTNLGDGAVTMGGLHLLEQAGAPGAKTIVAPIGEAGRRMWQLTRAHFPEVTLREKKLHLPRAGAGGPRNFLEAILETPAKRKAVLEDYGLSDTKYVIYAGGEHLFSLGRAGDDWKLTERLLPLMAAAEEGKRIVVLPATFGPFESPFSQALMRRLHRAADFLSARDASSADALEILRLPRPRTLLDPAFFLSSDCEVSAQINPKLVNIVMRLDGCGLRVGAEASNSWLSTLEAQGHELSISYRLYRDISAILLRAGYCLRFFIQCAAEDRPARLLARHLGVEFGGHRISIAAPASAQEMIKTLAEGATTLTSRFHAAIFSMLSGCPPIGIFFGEHGHKMPGLFKMFDLADLCFDGRVTTAEEVAAKIIVSIRDRDQVRHGFVPSITAKRAETLNAYRPYLK